MSKKMLKRTAALSALIAISLSGTVMAADPVTLTVDGTLSDGIFSHTDYSEATGDFDSCKNWELGSNTLAITGVNGNTIVSWCADYAVYANDYSFVGGENSKLHVSKADGTVLKGNGIATHGTINVDELVINVTGKSFYAAKPTSVIGNNITIISTEAEAAFASDGGTLSITANESINIKGAENAVMAGGGAAVKIASGDTQKADIVIDGDIGSYGIVDVKLETKDSSFTGASTLYYDTAQIGLTLADKAEWRTGGTKASFVNNLTMDGGIVKQNGTGDITVDNYSGTGSVVFQDETAGNVIVHNAASGAAVQLSMASITADDIQSADDLNKVANKLEAAQAATTLATSVYVKEGLINSEIDIPVEYKDTDGDGYYNANFETNKEGSSKPTNTVVATSGIAANAAVAWRDEDATFSQRLGELRNSEGDQGVWARMTQGEFERGNDFETEYNMFQIGYDKAKGDWHYGVAVSHNEGDTTYRIGSGEFTSTSVSAYGTWQGAKGHYKDIVAKIGVIDNEYTISAAGQLTKGDYDTTGTSISGEYGMKNDMGDGWYVTPLAKMTYMHIGSAGYTTNNGINVKHKSVDSLIARLGVELGKQLGTKGDVYVKASALHDFGGDADTVFRLGSNKAMITDEIGGTWYEVGIGFNYKTSDATYLYADVIKTYGDEIRTPWQWNVGARYSF